MLFEDLTRDISSEETEETSPAARMPLLDAYWQYLLTSPEEAAPAGPDPRDAESRELPLPAADRELATAL